MVYFNYVMILIAFLAGAVVEFFAFQQGYIFGEKERLQRREEEKAEREKITMRLKELKAYPVSVVDIKNGHS